MRAVNFTQNLVLEGIISLQQSGGKIFIGDVYDCLGIIFDSLPLQ
jgi:hypothetical protein